MDACLDPSGPNLLDVNRGIITIFAEGRVRWTSPEILDWNYRPTKESDVYALGMVIYQVRIFTLYDRGDGLKKLN